jgi:hypothetical protein
MVRAARHIIGFWKFIFARDMFRAAANQGFGAGLSF